MVVVVVGNDGSWRTRNLHRRRSCRSFEVVMRMLGTTTLHRFLLVTAKKERSSLFGLDELRMKGGHLLGIGRGPIVGDKGDLDGGILGLGCIQETFQFLLLDTMQKFQQSSRIVSIVGNKVDLVPGKNLVETKLQCAT